MNESEFWQLVQAPDPLANATEVAAQLEQKLTLLDDQQLAAFDKIFSQKMRLAYTWSLWGAAYVITQCDSEYDFSEFRCWLISRGQTIFEATLANPDNLAQFAVIPLENNQPCPFLDEYDLIAGFIFEKRTGEELPFVPSGQEQPPGKRFNDKPKMLKAAYPNLYQQYWYNG